MWKHSLFKHNSEHVFDVSAFSFASDFRETRRCVAQMFGSSDNVDFCVANEVVVIVGVVCRVRPRLGEKVLKMAETLLEICFLAMSDGERC